MGLIEFIDVTRIYRLGQTEVTALRSVNLQIEAGEFTAVTGPSGSGKSTLCHLIGAIDQPSSGQVIVGGKDLGSLDDAALSAHRNHSLGFIFQNFNLVPVLNALENTCLPLDLRGGPQNDGRARARKLLERLGLGAHLEHRPDKLSGGQRQRVAIARALITEPSIIIADEPTANLDSENALQILEHMRNFNREQGTTFVFSTHDPRLLEVATRVITLEDGQIVSDR